MADLMLAVLVVILPTAFAIAVELVSKDIKDKPYWRAAVLIFGLATSVLTGYQMWRADKHASKDRQEAVRETSASVAAETSDRVTKAMAVQYENTISGLNQQIGALQSSLDAMNKVSLDRSDRLATGISDAMRLQTGGNSFTYLGTAGISETGAQLMLLSQGKYPLYDVGVRVTDVRVLDATKNFIDSTVFEKAVGDMGSPRALSLGAIPFKLAGETQTLNIFFSGRNGFWTQLWRWRKVNGQWAYASLVSGALDQRRFPKGAILKREVTKGFPEDELLKDKDWQNTEKLPRAY